MILHSCNTTHNKFQREELGREGILVPRIVSVNRNQLRGPEQGWRCHKCLSLEERHFLQPTGLTVTSSEMRIIENCMGPATIYMDTDTTIPLRYSYILRLLVINQNIKVTVVGEPDHRTGMVMNITDLKQIMKAHIMDVLDHKNIDKQVDYFGDGEVVSTTENIAVFCWNSMAQLIPHPAKLYSVKIWETEKNIVSYYGN